MGQEDVCGRERISRILELREIFLSFQTGFNLVSALVVCTVLQSISVLEPSLVITEPRFTGCIVSYTIRLRVSQPACPFTLVAFLIDHPHTSAGILRRPTTE